MKIETIIVDNLSPGWRTFTGYSKCQPFGNKWHDEGNYTVLKVPSAVLPDSSNYVINPLHPDFKTIKLLKATDLIHDQRTDELLKNHKTT